VPEKKADLHAIALGQSFGCSYLSNKYFSNLIHVLMTKKQIVSDKATAYGIPALSIQELSQLSAYKPKTDFVDAEFFNSKSFHAMAEIVRRFKIEPLKKVTCSRDIYDHVSFLAFNQIEEFYALYFNRANKLIHSFQVSKGGIAGTVVDLPGILRTGIMNRACSIALVHNHPSGNLKPSEQDLELTRKIRAAAKLIDISIIDHLIVAGSDCIGTYYSFADEGTL